MELNGAGNAISRDVIFGPKQRIKPQQQYEKKEREREKERQKKSWSIISMELVFRHAIQSETERNWLRLLASEYSHVQ